MHRRLTVPQTAEVRYALTKIEKYLEGNTPSTELDLAAGQLRAFLDENGYRPQHCTVSG